MIGIDVFYFTKKLTNMKVTATILLAIFFFTSFNQAKTGDKSKWKEHVKQLAIEVKINSNSYEFSFLDSILADKRIVMLGEASHQVKEFNEIKYAVIKYLQDTHGYKVLLMERGLAETSYTQIIKEEISIDSILTISFAPVWKTTENLKLAELIKYSGLELSGFDFQFTDYKTSNDYIKHYTSATLKAETDNLFRLDSSFHFFTRISTPEEKLYREQVRDSLLQAHTILIDGIRNNSAFDLTTNENKILLKVLENRKFATSLYGTPRYTTPLRDSVMAVTLTWLLDSIYKDEKVIVWTHNLHLFKSYPKHIEKYPAWQKYPTGKALMGAELTKEIYEQSYIIGLYMHSGEVGIGRSRTKVIDKPKKNYLEYYLNASPHEVSFFDLTRSGKMNENNAWMFTYLHALSAGYRSELEYIINETFDGILFVKNVTPAELIK